MEILSEVTHPYVVSNLYHSDSILLTACKLCCIHYMLHLQKKIFIAKSACIIMWCFCLHSCGFVTHQQSHAERKHVGRHNMLGNKYSTISHILVMFFPVGNTGVHSPHRVLCVMIDLSSFRWSGRIMQCVCVCVCVCVHSQETVRSDL